MSLIEGFGEAIRLASKEKNLLSTEKGRGMAPRRDWDDQLQKGGSHAASRWALPSSVDNRGGKKGRWEKGTAEKRRVKGGDVISVRAAGSIRRRAEEICRGEWKRPYLGNLNLFSCP